MLPRKNRLKKKPEMDQIFRQGSFLSFGFLALKYVFKETPAPRLAFSIGTGYSPKATERNRAKRLLREAVKKNFDCLPKGIEGIFFVNKKKLPESKEQAEKELPQLARLILKKLAQRYS